MDSDFLFSISYEQITQAAEEEIRKCDLRNNSPRYLQELDRAAGILKLWSSVTLKGHPDGNGFQRVSKDRQRLRELMDYLCDNKQ